MRRWTFGPAGLAAATAMGMAVCGPARAQDAGDTVFDGNHLTIGVGVGYGPSYSGSDNYKVSVVPLVQGRLLGIGISPGPGGVTLDVVPDEPDAKVSFAFGPSARIRSNRKGRIKDPVVRSLGELDTAIEVGASAGISVNKLLNPYDSVTLSADTRWDVAGAHEGMVVSPTISYATPLSRASFVRLSLSADRVDDDYADYYYSITPEGNAASGLPVFKAEGGWKDVGAAVLLGLDLDGNALNGGFSVFALGGYSRLLGDFKRSPIVSIRGDADQWLAGAGLAYTF